MYNICVPSGFYYYLNSMNIKLLPLVMVFFVGGCFNKKWKQKPEHVYLEEHHGECKIVRSYPSSKVWPVGGLKLVALVVFTMLWLLF